MAQFTFVRIIGRSASANHVTVEAKTKAQAFILAAAALGTQNIRLHVK